MSLFSFCPVSVSVGLCYSLFLCLYFCPLHPVCGVSSRLISRTLVSRLLIILAAPTEEAVLCLTSMI